VSADRNKGWEAFSDEDLVGRFQQGLDPEGVIEQLYERHRTVTYAFFRRRIGAPEIAAEQNQELYLTVIKHLPGFRGDSKFRTWLFQIAHHQLSHLRRRWRVHLDERAQDVPDDLLDRLSTNDGGGPEQRASKAQVVRALRRCMAALPAVERVVILGQYYADVTLEDLTRQLGLTNKSGARASLIAGQRRLKKCLAQAGIDEPESNGAGEKR